MKHHEKLDDALHIIIQEVHQLRLSLILSLIFEFSKTIHLKYFETYCAFFQFDNTIFLIGLSI